MQIRDAQACGKPSVSGDPGRGHRRLPASGKGCFSKIPDAAGCGVFNGQSLPSGVGWADPDCAGRVNPRSIKNINSITKSLAMSKMAQSAFMPSLRAKRDRDILPKLSCPEGVNPEGFSADPNPFWVAASEARCRFLFSRTDPRNDFGGWSAHAD